MTTHCNKELKVFISSTFMDMNIERDYMINVVFPKIKEYCLKKQVEFYPLDLRWGVTEENPKFQHGRVLDICLKEIDSSRPFFIGILGGRYGWIPTENQFGEYKDALYKEHPWIREDVESGKSITEIEMLYAALRNKDIKHASFYIRSPKMSIDSDEFNEDQDSISKTKLQALKKKIISQKRYPSYEYSSLKEFGDRLYRDVIKMVNAEFKERGLMDDSHLFVARETARNYMPNITNYNAFKTWLTQPNKYQYLAVTDKVDGWGSSFLCYCAISQQKHINVIYHNLKRKGQSNVDTDVYRNDFNVNSLFVIHINNKIEALLGMRMRSVLFKIKNITKAILSLPLIALYPLVNSLNDIIESKKLKSFLMFCVNRFAKSTNVTHISWGWFLQLMKKLKKRTDINVVVFIDNIDPNSDISKAIVNIISYFPSNLRAVISVDSGTTTQRSLNSNLPKLAYININPPQGEIAAKYIDSYVGLHGKKFSSKQMNMILTGFFVDSIFLTNCVLDHLISYGDYMQIDNEIKKYIKTTTKEELINTLIDDIFEDYSEIIGEDAVTADNFHRDNRISKILSFIALSRNGLTENEIVRIIDILPIQWIIIRKQIIQFCRITDDRLTIIDSDIRNIIKTRTSNDHLFYYDAMYTFFNQLFDYKEYKCVMNSLGQFDFFENLEFFMRNRRQVEELPMILVALQKWKELFNFISYIENDKYLNKDERLYYWKLLYSKNYYMRNIEHTYSLTNVPTDDVANQFFANLVHIAQRIESANDVIWAQQMMQRKYISYNLRLL